MHIQFSFVTHFLTLFFRGIFSNLFLHCIYFYFFFTGFLPVPRLFFSQCSHLARSLFHVYGQSSGWSWGLKVQFKQNFWAFFFLFRYEMPRLDVMEKEERQWGGHLNSIQSWSIVDRGCWNAAKLNEKTSWVASARPAWVPTITGNFRPPLNDPLTVTKRGYLLLFQKPPASLLRALSRWAILFLRV